MTTAPLHPTVASTSPPSADHSGDSPRPGTPARDKALVKETTLDSVAGEEDPGASLDMVEPVVPQRPGAQ